nr:GntR family transcriptional regulator [Peptoniphilus sp. KCTC 25270]
MSRFQSKNSQLSAVAFNIIKDEILTLKLLPGQPIREKELTERLEISRTPIRSAIQQLTNEGFIEFHKTKGNLVSKLSVDHYLKIFDLREALEMVSIRLATQNWTKEDIEALEKEWREHNREVSKDVLDKEKILMADVNFHDLISKASKNELIQVELKKVNEKFYRYNYLADTILRSGKTNEEHKAIIEMIKTRNSTLAENMMAQHLYCVKNETLMKLLNQKINFFEHTWSE